MADQLASFLKYLGDAAGAISLSSWAIWIAQFRTHFDWPLNVVVEYCAFVIFFIGAAIAVAIVGRKAWITANSTT